MFIRRLFLGGCISCCWPNGRANLYIYIGCSIRNHVESRWHVCNGCCTRMKYAIVFLINIFCLLTLECFIFHNCGHLSVIVVCCILCFRWIVNFIS